MKRLRVGLIASRRMVCNHGPMGRPDLADRRIAFQRSARRIARAKFGQFPIIPQPLQNSAAAKVASGISIRNVRPDLPSIGSITVHMRGPAKALEFMAVAVREQSSGEESLDDRGEENISGFRTMEVAKGHVTPSSVASVLRKRNPNIPSFFPGTPESFSEAVRFERAEKPMRTDLRQFRKKNLSMI